MTDDPQAPQVLIVGAGPTGLVLALALRRNGVRVRLIEKDLAARIGQRGAGIMPRSLEIFHLLGVGDQIESQGIYSPRVRLYDMPEGTHAIQTFDMQPWNEPTPACPYLNIQHLGQDRLETIIRSTLAQLHCHVEQSAELIDFEQYPDRVSARIKTKTPDGQLHEETSNFDYLIGADGARGVVRKLLGLSFLGETRVVEHLVVGDVTVEGLTEEYWHMWGDASTTLVSLRPTETPTTFNFMIGGLDVDHDSLAHSNEAVIRFIYAHTGKMREHGMNVKEVTWLSHYRPNIRMVDTFGKGRVFVAGDSAHVHSPTGGQGMNTGVQDAFNLGWKLALVANGHAKPSLLDSFTEERLPVIADMLDQTTVILKKAFNGRIRSEEEKHWVEVVEVEQEDAEGEVKVAGPSTKEPRPIAAKEDSDTEDLEDEDDWEDDEERAGRQWKEDEKRPGSLLQLGVNYRWSSVTVDEQEQQLSKPISKRLIDLPPTPTRHDSYGRGFDGCLKAGDRAPDAPALRGIRHTRGEAQKSINTRLFQVFDPTKHTVLLFTRPGETIASYAPVVEALKAYPAELVRIAALYRSGVPSPIPTLEGIEYFLEDMSGFARDAYDVRGGCNVIVVRPDGVVGAVVNGVTGLKRYFDGIFSRK
ncbi:hypothetical protein PC9H_006490 [Pleurotus ostreatus]|uniref:FAD-binding domain-containing protein n=1 Tax=Pleurotus ostreatus TaxID=5322 RepID=A0A8H6ZTV8_PLEOS|nr:uncharacterized protein PC9H_006490 [Pleurotus ostreatus]KAF7430779.1 hypothetical protein PC9H_006490 [Pleurotus ostreatus]